MRSWSRRNFIKAAGAAGLTAGLPGFVQAIEALDPANVRISILHTTDLHGHILPTSDYNGTADLGGLARCVTQLRRWRRENRNSILLDIGDVYQGTDAGLRTKGELMIDLFNHLGYDAWVLGNHEFDWGLDVFRNAAARSTMPILAANTLLEGRPAGDLTDPKNSFSKIQPFVMKEIEGIKIAIVGVTTPGMPFWLRPEFTGGMDFQYPVEPVRRAILKAKGEGANAIVIAGHMGLKLRSGGDDFANNIMSLTTEFPEAAAFIAGHTHQPISSRLTNGVLVTQSDHFGIHVGRVDLVFDRSSKKLLHRQARCELMDRRIRLSHVVLSRAKAVLADSEAALAEPIGELAETLQSHGPPAKPSEVERLIAAAISEALQDRHVVVDGVFHGVFDEDKPFLAGPKTINDIWSVIPFENYLVTAQLKPEEIKAIMEEAYASHERRNLVGFDISVEGRGFDRRISSIRLSGGRMLERDQRYTIAFNTFDSRSGGHRFMRLRDLLETDAVRCQFHPIQTRDALIEYFRRHRPVQKVASAMSGLSAAA